MVTTSLNPVSRGLSALQRSLELARYRLELVNYHHQLPTLSASDHQIVSQLKREGAAITSLEQLSLPSTPAMLAAAQTYLQMMKAELAAPPHKPAYPHIYTMTDIPEFSNWGNDPRLLRLVENYIGLPTKFQEVHLRRDFPNETPVTTGLWHWDLEDRRMVKLFVYLTDATEAYGPLEYIPKACMSPWMQYQILQQVRYSDRMGLNDAEMAAFVPRSRWQRCSVPAGSVVLADPAAICHRGGHRRHERATLFFVYTAAHPLRPDHVLQYSDDTFTRPGRPNLMCP